MIVSNLKKYASFSANIVLIINLRVRNEDQAAGNIDGRSLISLNFRRDVSDVSRKEIC